MHGSSIAELIEGKVRDERTFVVDFDGVPDSTVVLLVETI